MPDVSTTSEISNIAPPLDTSMMTAEQRAAVESVQAQKDTTPGGALGKEEFLNLLVAQMANQDPLDPMDSTESIAQLAQFSALEQMQNVATQIESLRQSSGLIDAMLLQGQNVEAVDVNGATYSGTVESATWGAEGLVLTIGETQIAMSNIAELRLVQPVTEETTEETSTETSGDTAEETSSTPSTATSTETTESSDTATGEYANDPVEYAT